MVSKLLLSEEDEALGLTWDLENGKVIYDTFLQTLLVYRKQRLRSVESGGTVIIFRKIVDVFKKLKELGWPQFYYDGFKFNDIYF